MPSFPYNDWVMGLPSFVASDADQNDTVTGQTSFVATTPTFLLDVPLGRTAIPLFVNMNQTGAVAGGTIHALFEVDNADRYASGGTEETAFPDPSDGRVTNLCKLYSGATANAGYGARIDGIQMAPDTTPAVTESPKPGPVWRAEKLYRLVGPAAFLVFTWAGTTGPSWYWSIGWAESPSADIR